MHAHAMKTTRGYALGEVVSALQKAIRRGDERLAGYFAMELFESHFEAYAWRRLLTISAEDCHGCITQEIKALYDSAEVVRKKRKTPERIFLAKAAVLLAAAKKCRDADHMSCLMYDQQRPDDAKVLKALEAARKERLDIPDYAFDCHTPQGRRAGKTRMDFFVDEHEALTPRVPGLFDKDVDAVRATRKRR
jgi:replication-associated recombination protein RarA